MSFGVIRRRLVDPSQIGTGGWPDKGRTSRGIMGEAEKPMARGDGD